MYFDNAPCAICGSKVRLEGRTTPPVSETDGPVGDPDGVVGDADSTVDERVCTNPDCPSHKDRAGT